MLNPFHYRGGRKSHITPEQDEMLVERLLFAARRGFAADAEDTRQMMARIACLNGKPFKNGIPSADTVRLFRAKHRELAYRKHECKDKAKLHAESFEHVDPFFDIIHKVGQASQGMLKNGDRIWNIDETDVSAEFGERVKVFSDARSHHGGSRVAHVAGGNGRHFTLVIAASASGKICPPFFIVQGKNVMENWFTPFPDSLFQVKRSDFIRHVTTEDWFPRDGAVFTSDSGSMNRDVLHRFIQHPGREARPLMPPDDRFLLTIDGHASRKGVEWLEECVSISCDVVLAPANTSHFLQPCDQNINKRFKTEIRKIRDELSSIATFDHKSIQFKLMRAVYAHSRITVGDCVSAFCDTGLFPFNRQFAERFKKEVIDLSGEVENSTGANAIVRERSTAATVRSIIEEETNDSRMLQRLTMILNSAETTNSILMSHTPPQSISSASTRASTNRTVLCSGAPAEYLTIGAAMEKKRGKKAEEERRQLEKEQKKTLREEKKRAALAKKEEMLARRNQKKATRNGKKNKGNKAPAAKKNDGKRGLCMAHNEESGGAMGVAAVRRSGDGCQNEGEIVSLGMGCDDERISEKRIRSPTKHAKSPVKKKDRK